MKAFLQLVGETKTLPRIPSGTHTRIIVIGTMAPVVHPRAWNWNGGCVSLLRPAARHSLQLHIVCESVRRMYYSSTVYRVITVVNRFAVCTFAYVVLSSVPANADYIVGREPDRSSWLSDCRFLSATGLLGNDFDDKGGCAAATFRCFPTEPSPPFEPLPPEIPFVGLGIPANATGAGSDSSYTGTESSVSKVTTCSMPDLSASMAVGQHYSVQDLDVPPAPPFKLLRPPQVLTILA